jgi:hypothetical protein
MIELNAHDGQTGAFLVKLQVERPGNLSMAQAAKAADALALTKVS